MSTAIPFSQLLWFLYNIPNLFVVMKVVLYTYIFTSRFICYVYICWLIFYCTVYMLLSSI